MAKVEFNKKKVLFNRKLELRRSKLVKCNIWNIALYGVEIWT
jgi:hypothetical protein